MTLKPPSPKDGDAGLNDFRHAVTLVQESLKNKFDREFHRKELARWQKYYRTLSAKRPEESDSARHYAKLSKLAHRRHKARSPIMDAQSRRAAVDLLERYAEGPRVDGWSRRIDCAVSVDG